MPKLLRKCPKCNQYTLKETCALCNEKTISPHPVKFSPNDRYIHLRARIGRKSSYEPSEGR